MEKKKFAHHEKCVGGNCPQKNICLLHIIPDNSALWKIKPPFKRTHREIYCEQFKPINAQ